MVEKRYPHFANKQCKTANITLDSNIQRSHDRTVYWNNMKTIYREKEKWHQRNNLTVLSALPVARSGAVG